MATPAKPKGKWDPKDKAYEYLTKQPGTHWDAKDKAWEGPPQDGPNSSASPTSTKKKGSGSNKFDPIPVSKNDSARTKGIKAMLNRKRKAAGKGPGFNG